MEDKTKWIEAYRSGQTLKQIAIKFDVNPETIRRALIKAGEPIRSRNHKHDEYIKFHDEWALLYESGSSMQEIAQRYNVSFHCIRMNLKRMQVKSRSRTEMKSKKHQEKCISSSEHWRELYINGKTIQEIALLSNTSAQTVSDTLKSLGIKTINDYEEYREIWTSLYEQGVGSSTIAKIYKVQKKMVLKCLDKWRVEKRELTEYRKYSINKDAFVSVNNENTAYWLGFLFADGSITSKQKSYRIELSLAEKDALHIEKFKSFLECNAPTKRLEVKSSRFSEKRSVVYRIFIRSKKMVNDLIRLGCIPKKTFILNFPSNEIVPLELLNHFIRGYFDGDGSITTSNKTRAKISIISSQQFCESLKNHLELLGISSTIWNKNRNEKVKELNIHKQSHILIFYNYIYDNATTFLERKKRRIEELLSVSK